jgi:transposase-like protein
MTLFEFQRRFDTEAKCRRHLKRMRWRRGATCPRCGSKAIDWLRKREQFECRCCRYRFSVTAGTIFHKTHTPLVKWFQVLFAMARMIKSISAKQLAKDLALRYETAWRICHKIRAAMGNPSERALLCGLVEMDDAYVGGKRPGPHGRGAEGKSALIVAAEAPTGSVRAVAVKTLDGKAFGEVARDAVEPGSIIRTDGLRACGGVRKEGFAHEVHKNRVISGLFDTGTQTAHGFVALFKRGYVGAYHQMSDKYVQLYLNEYEFRHNHKNDEQILEVLLKQCVFQPALTG